MDDQNTESIAQIDWTRLPDVVWENISLHLKGIDIAYCAAVCKAWRHQLCKIPRAGIIMLHQQKQFQRKPLKRQSLKAAQIDWTRLPDVVWENISLHLKGIDIAYCAAVCKAWRHQLCKIPRVGIIMLHQQKQFQRKSLKRQSLKAASSPPVGPVPGGNNNNNNNDNGDDGVQERQGFRCMIL